jgi:hypothetical protein
MGLKEIGCEGMDRINLSQDKNKWQALVNTVLNLWVPYDWGMGISQLRNYYLLKKDCFP